MGTLRTLDRTEKAYNNMEVVCGLLNTLCKTETTYRVGVTYFDYGQDWKWTTIINSRGVQVLCPRDWEQIVVADTVTELARITEVIRNDKYFKE
jgi:hypothetical protein